MAGSEAVGIIRVVVEWAALTIELLGAAVIVAGVVRVAVTRGTVRYLYRLDQPGLARATSTKWGNPCCWAKTASSRRTPTKPPAEGCVPRHPA